MEKTKKENLVFDGRVIKLYNDEVYLDNGDTSKREYVSHRGGVCCLAIHNGLIYFEKQYRYAVRKDIFELPAGKLEIGEEPKEAMIRELKEELGFISNNMEYIDFMYPSVGYTNEKIYLFFSSDNTQSTQSLDKDECLSIHPLSIKEAYKMLDNNEIHDAKTVYLMLKLRKRLENNY